MSLPGDGKTPKLPSAADLKSFADALRPKFDVPNLRAIPLPNLTSAAEANYASAFHKRLSSMIEAFDADLDNEHEVGIRLVNFGQTVTFHLTGLGYYNPSLITFTGFTEGGDPVELIQHVSQISVLLMKMKRKNPEEPKRRMGFRLPGEDDEAEVAE